MDGASKTEESEKPRVCALIPAYNEERRIGATVAALRSRKVVEHVLVIDDGSKDSTAAAAQAAGASEVLTLPRNQGKGAALAAGFRHARDLAQIFLLLDADLGPSAAECVKLLPPILEGAADMAIGLLPPDPERVAAGEAGGGMGLVVGLARWGVRRRCGLALDQPLCGQRALRREVLDALGGRFSEGFGAEVGLTIQAAEKGFRIVEVETAFRHRVTGDDWRDVLHRGRQFMDVAQALFLSKAT